MLRSTVTFACCPGRAGVQWLDYVRMAGEEAMDNKPAQNIQDSFLNTVRKEKTHVTVYLMSGVKLSGRIKSFDKYSMILETNNQEQLIFKHAISTVVMTRSHAPLGATGERSGTQPPGRQEQPSSPHPAPAHAEVSEG